MLFSSPEFLFAFLPLFLVLYFLAPLAARNTVLFAASLFFYFTTSGVLTVILGLSVVLNHYLAHAMATTEPRPKKRLFVLGVVLNLLPLIYFKYATFLLGSANDLMAFFVRGWVVEMPTPLLPIGISFFTFQAISYLADIYEGRVRPAKSLIDFGMYHSCFPQLIAGPIVRYEEIAPQIRARIVTLDDLYGGAQRFCIGFAKKVILADPMGVTADQVFNAGANVQPACAWVGLIAYALQIYLDFSGYSDMAIGLGRAMGFKYPENFDQPYRSRSITEFWRRWHMTLSRWFRDYVYIPLGGNRRSVGRTYLNLLIVFFLCGLWHGAAYTFILWGLVHGFLITAERIVRPWLRFKVPTPIAWLYATGAVTFAWILFREPTLAASVAFVRTLLGFHVSAPQDLFIQIAFPADKQVVMGLAMSVALFPIERLRALGQSMSYEISKAVASIVIFLIGTVFMAANGFSPFIYFRF